VSVLAVTGCFTRELYDLLEQTFERVHGIYLDRGGSSFETLETVSAEEASRRVSDKCASVAAQVKHVTYYLQVLGGCIQKNEGKDPDWVAIYQQGEVTPEEWNAPKRRLRETKHRPHRHASSVSTKGAGSSAMVDRYASAEAARCGNRQAQYLGRERRNAANSGIA